ncbi:outer membrane protein assembly factor BamB family protein [Actinotalea solisilvae]|uniref:outer membrane protein assembly factor BamB family protein n=1 Tax=Actinotalea solisilvae TaxID=2072922 RepID=UPI0018F12A4C|nr:PQQ-binding-like beta-propeller repeat protein [Actinotalea solisilvae]
MVDVELEVEEDDAPSALALVAAQSPHHGVAHDDPGGVGPGEPVPVPAAAGPRPARSRTRRRVAVAAALAVVATAAGVATVVEDRRERERAAELAGLEGVVEPFAEPLGVTWRASTALGSTTADDLVLRWQETPSGLELQAIDSATGVARWSAPRGPGDGVDWCDGAAEADGTPVVVCWRVSPVPGTDADGDEETFEGVLVLLDAQDGGVIAEHPMALPSSGYGVLDGDVVLGYRDGGAARVVRLDAAAGTPVWEREVPLTARQLDGSYSAWLTVDAGLVLVQGATTFVLTPDGELLGTWDTTDSDAAGFSDARQGVQVDATAEGFGVWAQSLDRTGASDGTWYDRDGEEVAQVEGFLAEPAVSDGSAPHVLLTAPGTRFDLDATDLTTGERLWTVPLEGGAVLVRRDGAAVAADGRRVFAVDLVTGEERWSVAVPGVRPDLGSVTDGERVLVLARDGGWVLQAVGLDGLPLWRTPVPASVAMPDVVPPGMPALWAIGSRAVTTNGQVLVGLAPGAAPPVDPLRSDP